MTTPCPPAPNYARSAGIADCDYEQLTPFARSRLRNSSVGVESVRDTNGLSYTIGGFSMDHGQIAGLMRARRNSNCGEYMDTRNNPNHTGLLMARSNGRHMGRTVLPLEQAASWNADPTKGQSKGWRVTGGAYSGPSDSRLARDVWALQVAQWWLSDGNAFSNYEGQAGARSRWGGSSSLPATVVTDLATVLPRLGGNAVLGPDGMLGTEGVSVLANYIQSGGKLATNRAGTASVSVPNGAFKDAIERLKNNLSGTVIDQAKANVTGETSALAPAPCADLTAQARAARADCADGGTGGGTGGGDTFTGDEGDINWLVVGGIGALVLGLGVGGALYMKKRKSGSMGARREIASPEAV